MKKSEQELKKYNFRELYPAIASQTLFPWMGLLFFLAFAIVFFQLDYLEPTLCESFFFLFYPQNLK